MDTAKYPRFLKTLHWSMAVLIIGLLAMGFFMADIPETAPNKYNLYPLHKSLGMIVMLLLLLRLPARWRGPLPAEAAALEVWEQRLSHLVHLLLYVAMLAMTLSGYFMSSFYPHAQGIEMFGLFTIPDITSKSEAVSGYFHTLHSAGAWSFVVLLGLHIAGVVKHRFFDRPESNVLPRML